jgi:hypothetical protein
MKRATFIEVFDELLKSENIQLSKISDAESIFCFSDYAGDNEEHNIYSFLFVDYLKALETSNKIEQLRSSEPEWNSKSYIQYKKLNKDAVRARLLPRFLELADELAGNLFVISVHKSVDKLLFPDGADEAANSLIKSGKWDWKPHIAQRLTDIVAIKSYLATKIVSKNNRYFWLSDKDSINGDGKGRVKLVGELLLNYLNIFNVKYKDAAYGVNLVDDEDSNFYGDMLSLPDLVCGASLELLEQRMGKNLIKPTTLETLKWFDKSSSSLKKIHINIEKDQNFYRTAILNIKENVT